MNKTPTAKEYIQDLLYTTRDEEEDVHDTLSNVENAMIEFAKLHVEAALIAARNSAELLINGEITTMPPEQDGGSMRIYDIDEKSILNSYPLDQIK